MGFRVCAFNHLEAGICMANIWGNGVLRAGTACVKKATLVTAKEQREGRCGTEQGGQGMGRPGEEARPGGQVRPWIYLAGGEGPWRALCCPKEFSTQAVPDHLAPSHPEGI